MSSPILFVGGEDLSFQPIGGNFVSTGAGILVNTGASSFRAGYARHSLTICSPGLNMLFLRAAFSAPASSFWFTARVQTNTNGTGPTNSGSYVWLLGDAAGVWRLRMRNTTAALTGPFVIEKVSAAGVATQLGNNTSTSFLDNPAVPDRLDVFVNHATSGGITMWQNGVQVFSYTGDVTTDGVTALAALQLGQVMSRTTSEYTSWSEVVVATRDTRNMSVVTRTALAAGNATSFTSGAASNVNEALNSDATADSSSTPGQIQEYTVTPALPTGSFSVLSVVHHLRATIGSSGPTKVDAVVRAGGTDYTSGDLSPGGAWTLLVNNWDTNPNTGNAWQAAEIANGSTLYNIGYKSVA